MNVDINPDSMDSEIKAIQSSIETKQYATAIFSLKLLLQQSVTDNNKDVMAQVLEMLNSICDKTPETIDITLDNIKILLDYPDDWVRLESLLILKKLYAVHPKKFDAFVEKIESKLFDTDKKVRETAVSIVAQIMKTELSIYPELYLSYNRMFEDESWIVRARAVEGALNFCKNAKDIPAELMDLFQQSFLRLLEDSDEEVRGFATEALQALFARMPPERFLPILNNLLVHQNWEIREKAIWLVGELGKMNFDAFIPIFSKMIPMFADSVMIIQTKVIDAFVKVGQNSGPQLLNYFIPSMTDSNDDIRQGISDTLIYVSLQNKRVMLPKLIDQLESPTEQIQKLIGVCLLKIYMESPDGIEEELFRMFQNSQPEDWRYRKRNIQLLGNLVSVLKIKSIASWTVITLSEWRSTEKDVDVLEEIDTSLAKIHNLFENLDNDITDIDQKKKFFYDEMDHLQKLPQDLRNKVEELITAKKFSDAEILLEEHGNRLLEKVNKFEQTLFESDFKRFSVDMLEDWNDIKEEVLEELSDVKSFEYTRICDGRSDYAQELEKILSKIKGRIEVLRAEFDNTKDTKAALQKNIQLQDSKATELFLQNIASLREKIYNLEFDVGQIWINNLEFKDFLKDITILWINIKIEIQQFLADVIHDFNILRQEKPNESAQAKGLKQKITFEFLNQEFQNAVMQAIQNQRETLEKFTQFVKPINDEIQKKKFDDARHILEMTISNLHTTIESSNREINRIYEEVDKCNIPMKDANEIRRYLNHWNEVKDLLLEKIRNFKTTTEDDILINQIIEFQRYVNPLPLTHLSRLINVNLELLREKTLGFMNDHQIHAVLREDMLVQLERPQEERFISIYRKVDILGSKLDIAIRIYNPTKYFLKDLALNFKYPEILQLDTNSDLTNLNIREFEPEGNRIIRWTFKINKTKGTEKRYDMHKLFLKLEYKNPFNQISTLEKEMELII